MNFEEGKSYWTKLGDMLSKTKIIKFKRKWIHCDNGEVYDSETCRAKDSQSRIYYTDPD